METVLVFLGLLIVVALGTWANIVQLRYQHILEMFNAKLDISEKVAALTNATTTRKERILETQALMIQEFPDYEKTIKKIADASINALSNQSDSTEE